VYIDAVLVDITDYFSTSTMSSMDTEHTPGPPAQKWLVHGTTRVELIKDWPSHSTLAVEVRLKSDSTARFNTISKLVRQCLEQDEQIYLPSTLEGWQSNSMLEQNVELIRVTESS
jgi:hypothetical protein